MPETSEQHGRGMRGHVKTLVLLNNKYVVAINSIVFSYLS